jgi:hypothetical protein
MILKLINNVTHKEYEIWNDVKGINGYYVYLNIILPDGMDDGEYNYQLIHENKIIATGLLQIGKYEPEINEYNTEDEIIQYNGR